MTTEIPEQVYRDAAKAMVTSDYDADEDRCFEWHPCARCPQPGQPCACAGDPWPSPAVRAAVESAYRAGEDASPSGSVLILTRQEFGATVYGLLTPGQRAEISYLHNTLKADHHEGCAAHGESTSCCVDTMTGTERTS